MDFQFFKNEIARRWIISAPRRAHRPDVAHGGEPPCPFCVGGEGDGQEVFRIPSAKSTTSTTGSSAFDTSGTFDTSPWAVRVLFNKFPFAPVHEVVILSPDHHKSFDQLDCAQTERILQTYRQRYNEHMYKGQVVIFHNHGERAGESLPHPHSQLAVVPDKVLLDAPLLTSTDSDRESPAVTTHHFLVYCPTTSQWPDEVWIAPKKRGLVFGEIKDLEIADLAHILHTLLLIFDHRHGNDFSYNFYICPGEDWYLRIIPRVKTIGGFELATGIFVNTQDPKETAVFIATHFHDPDIERIRNEHQAAYQRHV